MDWITAMQNALDYIEAHLTENIDYEKIAADSFFSNHYFQRTFGILCGYTLGEYIRFRRLSLAGEELAKGKKKVIDMALKYGYDSPDSFAKAFQKFHGITPSQARVDGKTLKSFSRLRIKISLEGGNIMNYKVEEKQAFYVLERVGVHTVVNDENKVSVPAFWEKSNGDGSVDKLVELSSDKGYLFGICYGNSVKNDPTFEYSIAVKCDKDTVAPEGFRKNLIPAKTWLVFSCVGAMPDAIQETWQKIMSEFFPTSVYQPTCEMDIEAYMDGDMDSPDYRSEIWIPVKKK